jgi:hypothetical protein
VPWIPALILLSIALRGPELEAAAGWLARSPFRLLLATLIFAAFAIPQVIGPVDAAGYDHRTLRVSSEEVWVTPILPTAECPIVPDVKLDSQGYYDCLHQTVWRTHPLLIARAYRAIQQTPVFLFALLTLAALASLIASTTLRTEVA